MKRKIAAVLIGISVVMSLGACSQADSLSEALADKLDEAETKAEENESDDETIAETEDVKDAEAELEEETGMNSSEAIALLGDLVGDKYSSASDGGSSDDDSSYDSDAPENATVVTKADEWQGFYYGTVSVIGFGDYYSGIEESYEAYGVVIYPDDDNPFMEIYSDEFDIWTNISFGYEDEALVSMYVDPTDTALTPVVYDEGDAYVVDAVLTEEEAQAFKSTSDGKSVARIVGQYNYVDPEGTEEGLDTGLLMLFNLTKEPIDD